MNKKKALKYSLLILLACSLFGFLGDIYWVFDLFSHFRVHYIYVICVLTLLALIFKVTDKALLLFAFVGLAVNLAFIYPHYKPTDAAATSSQTYKVKSVNLSSFNQKKELFLNYLNSNEVDFLFLYEVTPEWAAKIKSLRPQLPYARAILQNNNFGIGVLSKFELGKPIVFRDDHYNIPAILVEASVDTNIITLVAAHPFPPITSAGKKSRDSYLSQLSAKVSKIENDVIMCGDFNTTPWSKAFSSFLAQANLQFPWGFGVIPTWPSAARGFGIPIDHCLASKKLIISQYKRGPYIGSDHLPIEMELMISSGRQPGSK